MHWRLKYCFFLAKLQKAQNKLKYEEKRVDVFYWYFLFLWWSTKFKNIDTIKHEGYEWEE
jgi:hypothetical protein